MLLATAEDLREDVKASRHYRDAQAKLDRAQANAPEVTAHYLRLLWEATKPAIDRAVDKLMVSKLLSKANTGIVFD